MTNEQEALLKKIAAFPIEAQNVLKKDDDVVYAFNDWRLTVGDVKHARTMLEAASQETPEQDEVARLKGEIEDLNSSFDAWFDLAEKTAEEVGPVLIDGLRAYLRTSRSGGMSARLSNQIEAVLADYCRLYVGNHLTPVLRSLAGTPNGGDPEAREPDRLLLLQARYVLRSLDKERPGCAYGKLADACERVALARISEPEVTADTSARKSQAGVSDDLVQRSKEVLEWRRTGLLHGGQGGALRALAKRLEEGGLSDVHSLDVAQDHTNKEALAELIRLATVPQPTSTAKLPQVMWWNGKEGPATTLAETLETYAKVRPGADRDKWAMQAAATWIRKVAPAYEMLLAAIQSPSERVSMYLIVGVDQDGDANWDICLKLEDAAERKAEMDEGSHQPNKVYFVQAGRDLLVDEIDQAELDKVTQAALETPAP